MIDKKDLMNVAKLSRLSIEDSEMDMYLKKLNGIFEWIDQLNSIDVSNVDITSPENFTTTPERKDEVIMKNNVDQVLSNAPSKKFGMFEVPKVVE